MHFQFLVENELNAKIEHPNQAENNATISTIPSCVLSKVSSVQLRKCPQHGLANESDATNQNLLLLLILPPVLE